MRVIVFGASGGTGRCVLDGRDHVVTGSVHDSAQVEAAIRGHDVVISRPTLVW